MFAFPLFGVLANNNSSAESKAQVVSIIGIMSLHELKQTFGERFGATHLTNLLKP